MRRERRLQKFPSKRRRRHKKVARVKMRAISWKKSIWRNSSRPLMMKALMGKRMKLKVRMMREMTARILRRNKCNALLQI